MSFKRVGVAISRPRGGRKLQYGIFALAEAYGRPIDPPSLYIRFEGYREGDCQVGLPSAGQEAWWNQPMISFDPDERVRVFGPGEPQSVPAWESVRFFEEVKRV